jgi:uncharacterized protein (DUF433 family)
MKQVKAKSNHKGLVREMYGGEVYEYYPLGKYIVAAPRVCRGRPTFKYTRIEVSFVLDLLAAGWSMEKVSREYKGSNLSTAAIREAIQIARRALLKTSLPAQLAA